MFNGTHRAHDRIKLDIFFDFFLATNSGRIDQIKFKTKAVVFGIDTVTGSSSYIGNNIALFSNQGVDKRGFPSIGSSYHGKAR